MKVRMRSVVLEGETDRWPDLLRILGEYGEFQPDRSVQTPLTASQDALKTRLETIRADVEAWTTKLQLDDSVGPIADTLDWPLLEFEVESWDTLIDCLDARWREYLPVLQRVTAIDPVRFRRFIGIVVGRLRSGQLEALDCLTHARRSLTRFATFVTILPHARVPEVQDAVSAVGADVRWEPLDEELGLFLAFRPDANRSTLLDIVDKHQLIDVDALITSLHVLRFHRLVASVSRTIDTLCYAVRFGATIRVAGYAPEQTVPVLEEQLREVGFNVASGQRRNLPVSTSLPRYVQNFDKLIAMYSSTSAHYEEVDPTLAVAVTFPLFFGFMFGDVGQGLLLLILGAFLSYAPTITLYRRGLWQYRDWGAILFLCGLASTVFGAVYGELFGFSLSTIGYTPLIDAAETSMTDIFAQLALITIIAGYIQLTLGLLINVVNNRRRGGGTVMVRPISLAVTYTLGFVYIGGVTGFLPPLLPGFSYEPYLTTVLVLVVVSISAALIVEPLFRLRQARRDRQVATLEAKLEAAAGELSTSHFSTVIVALPTGEADRVQQEIARAGIDATVEPYDVNTQLLIAYGSTSREGELIHTVNTVMKRTRLASGRTPVLMHPPQDFSNVLLTVRNEAVEEVQSAIRRIGISTTVRALNHTTSIILAHCLPDRLDTLSQTVAQYRLNNVVLAPYTREPEASEGFTTSVVNYFIELIELASNTISYIRLAVLFLVHVLLMRVVNGAIALGLLGLPVLILGNLGVTALEGLVVFIQSLRLHFYEFFSKFFQGGGTQYAPVTTTSRHARVTWTSHPPPP
jgi:vacuolar-type H+-ATPase subunit I/STV1